MVPLKHVKNFYLTENEPVRAGSSVPAKMQLRMIFQGESGIRETMRTTRTQLSLWETKLAQIRLYTARFRSEIRTRNVV